MQKVKDKIKEEIECVFLGEKCSDIMTEWITDICYKWYLRGRSHEPKNMDS